MAGYATLTEIYSNWESGDVLDAIDLLDWLDDQRPKKVG